MPGRIRELNVFFRSVVVLSFVLLGAWWTILAKGKLDAREHELAERTEALEHARAELATRTAENQRLARDLEARAAEVERLGKVVVEKEKAIRALELANRLLKVQHRVAVIDVLAQGAPADAPEAVRTTVRFTELAPDGEPIGAGKELTVEGRTLYVESLVIQFEDRYVEQGDALRGTSLCLFKRLFGENQSPRAGVALDSAGQQPLAYGGDTTDDPVHRALWERFWDYANEPSLAKELGVRTLQGEAPFIEARVGKRYRVELRASGGLVLAPE